jgi:hypothetical protein
MTSRLNPAQLALGVVCAVLIVLLGYMVFAPIPEIAVPRVQTAQDAPDDDDTPLARFQVPPKEAFVEVDERLVFNPSRVRVVSAAQPGGPTTASLPSDLSLVGVILDGDTKLALIKSQAAPLAVGVTVGGTIEGWEVTRVDPDRVALRAGGPEQELTLSSNNPPPATGPNGGQPRVGPGFQRPGFPRPPALQRPNFQQPNNNGNNNNANNNNNNNNNNDDDDDN